MIDLYFNFREKLIYYVDELDVLSLKYCFSLVDTPELWNYRYPDIINIMRKIINSFHNAEILYDDLNLLEKCLRSIDRVKNTKNLRIVVFYFITMRKTWGEEYCNAIRLIKKCFEIMRQYFDEEKIKNHQLYSVFEEVYLEYNNY